MAGQVTIRIDVQAGTAMVQVTDNGPGFPPEFLERAFERFATADPARQRGSGTGLGLAIARSVVEAHGGEIWIEAARPGGVVAFSLPLAGGVGRDRETQHSSAVA